VFLLKHWLQEKLGYDERSVVLEQCNADGAERMPVIDPFSLVDLPGVSPGATLHVWVEGEIAAPEPEAPSSSAAAGAEEDDEDEETA
jgi:hypothetical protein